MNNNKPKNQNLNQINQHQICNKSTNN